MTDKRTKDAIDTLKILSNSARWKILRFLFFAQAKKRDVCVSEIAKTAGISQSAASHQLARLEDKRLVCSSRMGQMMCYKICDSPFTAQVEKIIKIFDS